jgi:hypothetical protein
MTVEPLFLKEADMPSPNIAHIEIVRAMSRSISPQVLKQLKAFNASGHYGGYT